VYQISGQSDNEFAFYDNFCCLTKRGEKQEKNEKTKPNFKIHISETPGEIWNVR